MPSKIIDKSSTYIDGDGKTQKSLVYYSQENNIWYKLSNLYGGYAGPISSSSKRRIAIKFVVPEFTGVGLGLTVTIPFIRDTNNGNTSTRKKEGIFTLTLCNNKPLKDNSTGFDSAEKIAEGTVKWASDDLEVHDVSYTFSNVSITAGNTYWLIIESNNLIEVSHKYDSADALWNFEIPYYSNGTSPSLAIKDNGNNTATLSGALGKSGSGNKMLSAVIYYTTNGKEPAGGSNYTTEILLTATSGASYSKNISIPAGCSTIKAVTYCQFEYNLTSTNHITASVKYYAAPYATKEITLSYNKTRLTVKEPWKFTWTAAEAANTNSPVVGYYLMLLRQGRNEPNFSFVREITSSTSNNNLGISPGSNSDNDSNYFTRRDNTSCTAVLQSPAAFGFVAGDKVKFRVKAFTKYGTGAILQSATYWDSDEYEIQNAGIMDIKVGNVWKEGQVYVKVAGAWKEAETVSVKVSGAWKESQ